MRATTRRKAPPIVHDVLRSPGQLLEPSTRRSMESRFHHDFSAVRVHAGRRAALSADAVSARAYTVGTHVVLGEGEDRPDRSDKGTLAHELTHVVQQGGAQPSDSLTIAPSHDAAEGEADRIAHAAAPSRPSHAATGLQRKPKGEDDPIHAGMGARFRKSHGLPEPGDDDRAGPTDAEIKYRLTKPSDDIYRIHIDAIPDMLVSDAKARDIHVHVDDSSIAAIEWMLTAPDDTILPPGRIRTNPGDRDATNRPWKLDPKQLGTTGPGLYHLTCIGFDHDGWMAVRAVRDFRLVDSDLKTGTAVAGKHGALKFTKYEGYDGPLPGIPCSAEATLELLPGASVNCTEVGWIQAVQVIGPDGENYLQYYPSNHDARRTPMVWSTDRMDKNAPSAFFGTLNTGNVEVYPAAGHFGGTAAHPEAQMIDKPICGDEGTYRFEACAICRSAPNAGQVYGCATWGFTSDGNNKIKMHPRSFSEVPSNEFTDANAMWNRWRSSLPAATRPEEAAPALRSP